MGDSPVKPPESVATEAQPLETSADDTQSVENRDTTDNETRSTEIDGGGSDDVAGEPLSELDERSIYLGNLKYLVTPKELEAFCSQVGPVEKVSIIVDRLTGLPTGYAFVAYEQKESVALAVEKLDGTMLRDRLTKVRPKQAARPKDDVAQEARSSNRGRGRGRGYGRGRGRGRGRGGFRGRGSGRGRGGSHEQTSGSSE